MLTFGALDGDDVMGEKEGDDNDENVEGDAVDCVTDSSSAVGTGLANDDDVGCWEATPSFGVGIIVD